MYVCMYVCDSGLPQDELALQSMAQTAIDALDTSHDQEPRAFDALDTSHDQEPHACNES